MTISACPRNIRFLTLAIGMPGAARGDRARKPYTALAEADQLIAASCRPLRETGGGRKSGLHRAGGAEQHTKPRPVQQKRANRRWPRVSR